MLRNDVCSVYKEKSWERARKKRKRIANWNEIGLWGIEWTAMCFLDSAHCNCNCTCVQCTGACIHSNCTSSTQFYVTGKRSMEITVSVRIVFCSTDKKPKHLYIHLDKDSSCHSNVHSSLLVYPCWSECVNVFVAVNQIKRASDHFLRTIFPFVM